MVWYQAKSGILWGRHPTAAQKVHPIQPAGQPWGGLDQPLGHRQEAPRSGEETEEDEGKGGEEIISRKPPKRRTPQEAVNRGNFVVIKQRCPHHKPSTSSPRNEEPPTTTSPQPIPAQDLILQWYRQNRAAPPNTPSTTRAVGGSRNIRSREYLRLRTQEDDDELL